MLFAVVKIHETQSSTQTRSTPHTDPPAATVDPAAAAVDAGTEPGTRANAAGQSSAGARGGRRSQPAATETPAHTAEAEIQDTDTAPPEPGEPEPSATLDDADWNDYSVASSDDEDNDYTQGSISGATLREHLLNQLIVSPLTLRDRTLVAALIDDLTIRVF